MAANQAELSKKLADNLKPSFAELGLSLESFVVENISLPGELEALLDQRIGMSMIGDMSKYTQLQVARSMPIAAANEGGGAAGVGVGLGAGLTMAQSMLNAMKSDATSGTAPAAAAVESGSSAAAETKFCMNCGKSILRRAKFCPNCGGAQE